MNKLKKKRIELELTQYDVEKLTGISQSKLSLFEGDYREPNESEKKKIARVLRAEKQELFDKESQ